MDKENYLPQAKANQKPTPKRRLKASYLEAIENEIWESLSKLEHRVEILMAVSHNQQASGCHELAEAYKKQAMKSKAYAQSIRKLLTGLT